MSVRALSVCPALLVAEDCADSLKLAESRVARSEPCRHEISAITNLKRCHVVIMSLMGHQELAGAKKSTVVIASGNTARM
jgi:hypothetical protein